MSARYKFGYGGEITCREISGERKPLEGGMAASLGCAWDSA